MSHPVHTWLAAALLGLTGPALAQDAPESEDEPPLAVPQESRAADAGTEAVEIELGHADTPPTVIIPAGVETTLRLSHIDDWGSAWSGRGGPPGLVVHPDGTTTYTPPPEHAGRAWLVDLSNGLRSTGVWIEVVPAGHASAVTVREAPPEEPRRGRGSSDARPWLYAWGTGLGGWIGGNVGYAVGDAADGFEGRGPGAFLGTVLGAGAGLGTTALVLELRDEEAYTHDQFALLATSSGLGAWAGHQAARAFIPPDDEDALRRIALAGALGSMAGAGVGVTLTPDPPPAKVSWNVDLGALIGWQAAAGASDMAGLELPADRQLRSGIALAGGTAGGAVVGSLRAAGIEGPDIGILSVSMVEGAWIGAWAPLLVTRDPVGSQVGGGLRLGLGAGYVLSQALAPLGPLDRRTLGLQSALWASGSALGAGIPLALGWDPADSDAATRAVVAPMLGGGLLGLATGTAAGPAYDLSSNDVALLSTLGVWTGYQALGWGFFGRHLADTPTVATGYALTAAGAGTVFATALAPMIEVDTPEALLIASAGGWGTWYGGWIGHLAQADPDTHWALTLGAGNVALLTTAGLTAGPVRAGWSDLAFIDGLTAVGGATGALVGLIASSDLDAVATSSLVGTSLGLAGGLYLALRPTATPAVAELAPLERLDIDLPVQARVMARPWMDDHGQSGVWIDLHVLEK